MKGRLGDWRLAQSLNLSGLVRAYADAPRITITALTIEETTTVSGTEQLPMQGLDLLHDSLRGIAYPGQAKNAEQVYQMTRGMSDTFLEKGVGEMLLEGEEKSAAGILQAAAAQGIPLIYVDADNLAALGDAVISDEARGRIWQAIELGYGILLPSQMVEWNNEQATAWWQIDLQTGETIGVGEDGTHQWLVLAAAFAIVAAHILLTLLTLFIFTRYVAWQEATELTWETFWREQLVEARQDNPDSTIEELYQITFQKTKTYMKSNAVWEDFMVTCLSFTWEPLCKKARY